MVKNVYSLELSVSRQTQKGLKYMPFCANLEHIVSLLIYYSYIILPKKYKKIQILLDNKLKYKVIKYYVPTLSIQAIFKNRKRCLFKDNIVNIVFKLMSLEHILLPKSCQTFKIFLDDIQMGGEHMYIGQYR